MPTQADAFVILLIVVVVFWAARMGTLGDRLGSLLRRLRSSRNPPAPAPDDRPR